LSERPDVRLPRWSRIALLLAPLDLLLVGWAIALNANPARVPSLVLIGVAFLIFLAVLVQSFAWVTVIAFFARERATEGLFVAAVLFGQLVSLLTLLWLAAPALRSRSG